jgi:hypothetical protein
MKLEHLASMERLSLNSTTMTTLRWAPALLSRTQEPIKLSFKSWTAGPLLSESFNRVPYVANS